MNDMETHLVLCDCGQAEHQLIWRYFPGEQEPQEQLLYIDIHLRAWEGFFRRLWAGLRYAFGHRSKYGDWDDVIIDKRAARKLRSFIDEFINDAAEYCPICGNLESAHTIACPNESALIKAKRILAVRPQEEGEQSPEDIELAKRMQPIQAQAAQWDYSIEDEIMANCPHRSTVTLCDYCGKVIDYEPKEPILVNPNILGGEPYIQGTRIPTAVILDGLAEGLTFDELSEHYPRLTKEMLDEIQKQS